MERSHGAVDIRNRNHPTDSSLAGLHIIGLQDTDANKMLGVLRVMNIQREADDTGEMLLFSEIASCKFLLARWRIR